VGSTEYKRGSRDCSRPMAGSPRIIARPTIRSRAACRRARVRQGQAFGGAEEAPSLTATARDGDGNVRSGWKNARGAGRTKEWSNNARQKWRDAPLTKKAPYKPDRIFGPLRFEKLVDLGIGKSRSPRLQDRSRCRQSHAPECRWRRLPTIPQSQ